VSVDGFAEIPAAVLGPLAGRPAAEWSRAPAGTWSPAQIVEHLAISLDWSGRKFEERRHRAPMARRRRGVVGWLGYWCVVRLGWFPRGFRAPAGTRPGPAPDPAAVERRFREGHARFVALAAQRLPGRRDDLLVKHPVLGDLTFDEWRRFHVVHCAHHARQLRERLGP
jgi:hypothetical protein